MIFIYLSICLERYSDFDLWLRPKTLALSGDHEHFRFGCVSPRASGLLLVVGENDDSLKNYGKIAFYTDYIQDSIEDEMNRRFKVSTTCFKYNKYNSDTNILTAGLFPSMVILLFLRILSVLHLRLKLETNFNWEKIAMYLELQYEAQVKRSERS